VTVSYFGIRHHGPGCARSVVRALERLSPDLVLVEGPPEANQVLHSVIHPDMKPPVALLVYEAKQSQRASFYPYANFSPEWQAISYALNNQTSVQLIDLPVSHKFALASQKSPEIETDAPTEIQPTDSNQPNKDDQPNAVDSIQQTLNFHIPEITSVKPSPSPSPSPSTSTQWRLDILRDPLSYFGQLAGYGDGEAWWEKQVELNQSDDQSLFEAVAEMMTELRQAMGGWHFQEDLDEDRLMELRREASMRKIIRKALKEGFTNIAVICGAWHVPALKHPPKVKEDHQLLKGLPKTKVVVTWIPWTFERMSIDSGYSAGVTSPGFYSHLWQSGQSEPALWLSKVARALRKMGLDISPAHIIETLRLAETLSALRHFPVPRLEEMNEAIKAVMLFGDERPLELIKQHLMIGNKLGHIPPNLPATPIEQDLRQLQKRLRLPPKAEIEEKTLDVRKPIDLERSYLLHRLTLLDIQWGVEREHRGEGTFKEAWSLEWHPEFTIDLIDRSRWGQTIEEASVHYALHQSIEADLSELTTLAQQAIIAHLPAAIKLLMHRLKERAAVTSDMTQMLMAIPPLAELLKYSDVRGSKIEVVEQVIYALVPRVCIGLIYACRSLDNDSIAEMTRLLTTSTKALTLIDQTTLIQPWLNILESLCDHHEVDGQLRGRACRLLIDTQHINSDKMITLMSLALSRSVGPDQSSAWLEGFLSNSGQILIYDDLLLRLVDDWVCQLQADIFNERLPIIRRIFSTFSPTELRQVGERIKHGEFINSQSQLDQSINVDRAQVVLPIIAKLLGIESST
jgi:hypothetical protein